MSVPRRKEKKGCAGGAEMSDAGTTEMLGLKREQDNLTTDDGHGPQSESIRHYIHKESQGKNSLCR